MRQKPGRPCGGFTIAEVMIASGVMLLGIVSAIFVIQAGFKSLDTARSITLASQVIQSEMERIRLLSWTAVAALPANETLDIQTILPPGETAQRIARRFTVKRSVTDVSGKVGSVREITLSVTWRGIDGTEHVRTTGTHYTRNGLYDYYYTKARD